MLSEWVKLRRRGMLGALLAAVAVSVLGTVITIVVAKGHVVHHRGPLGGTRTTGSLAQVAGQHGMANALISASTLLGLIALGVVAAAVAGEFSGGTLRNLLVREPRRVRLLLGKFLALAVAGTVVIATIFSTVAGILTANDRGINIHAWATGSGIVDLLVTVVEIIFATIGWGALGAILAVLLRSSVVAIVVGLVYALAVESILVSLDKGLNSWLPGRLLTAIAAGGNSSVSLSRASLTISIYALIAITAVTGLFAKRDVTE
jgi:ABC-type transport system involved in multi-copper enzyme maturation permease subunit